MSADNQYQKLTGPRRQHALFRTTTTPAPPPRPRAPSDPFLRPLPTIEHLFPDPRERQLVKTIPLASLHIHHHVSHMVSLATIPPDPTVFVLKRFHHDTAGLELLRVINLSYGPARCQGYTIKFEYDSCRLVTKGSEVMGWLTKRFGIPLTIFLAAPDSHERLGFHEVWLDNNWRRHTAYNPYTIGYRLRICRTLLMGALRLFEWHNGECPPAFLFPHRWVFEVPNNSTKGRGAVLNVRVVSLAPERAPHAKGFQLLPPSPDGGWLQGGEAVAPEVWRETYWVGNRPVWKVWVDGVSGFDRLPEDMGKKADCRFWANRDLGSKECIGADVYAVGVALWMVLNRRVEGFRAKGDVEWVKGEIPGEVVEIVERCVHIEPGKRPSLKKVKEDFDELMRGSD